MSDNNEALNRSCQTALSWSTLRTIILSSDLVKLARSEEQKLVYRNGRERIHSEWESIYDYLLCAKFGFEEIVQTAGKKRSNPTFEQLKSQSSNSYKMQLCLNDYPYHMESGIDHWILWKLGDQHVGGILSEEIDRAKLKIFCQCVLVNCNDNGIQMKVDSSLPTLRSPKEDIDTSNVIHDDSLFLHWINPPHLKRDNCIYRFDTQDNENNHSTDI
eukprot:scaffold27743_cov65-Cyclotella_meneghiniana.AAC.1